MKRGLAIWSALGLSLGFAQAEVVFDNIPGALAPNYPSLGFETNMLREFGNEVTLAGTDRILTAATFTLSSRAKKSDWLSTGDASGYAHDFTLNLYKAADDGSVGSLLGSKTISAYVPFRPEDVDGSGYYQGPDGNYYKGLAFNVQFNLADLALIAPDKIIYGLCFNTTDAGYAPLGGDGGPYDALNVALTRDNPTMGQDTDPDDLYLNSAWPDAYLDGGYAGFDVFRRDQGWSGLTPMARFEAVPEPASMLTLAMGLLIVSRRRRG